MKKSWLALAVLGLATGDVGTQEAARTPDAVRSEIDALIPARLAWSEIDWKTCPLEALKEAREKKRPVVAWVFLGNPSDERC